MVKIDFKYPFVGLDGKVSGNEEMLNIILANFLATSEAQGIQALKMGDWASNVFNDGFITVDDTDRNVIREFILSHRQMTSWLKKKLVDRISLAEELK